MISKRFIQHPIAQRATAQQPQRATKQGMSGQLLSICLQDTTTLLCIDAQLNTKGADMTAQLPQTTQCEAQGAQATTAVVAAAVAPVAGPVAGVQDIAEPCVPEAQIPAMAATVDTTELNMGWHTQELFVGPELNIALLPCLGLLGHDIDFPGTPEPGGLT